MSGRTFDSRRGDGVIDPDRLYSWPHGLERAIGFDAAWRRHLRAKGQLQLIAVRTARFVRGRDVIEAIERLGILDDPANDVEAA